MTTKTFWKTIDHIGSGYVLQEKWEVDLNNTGNELLDGRRVHLDTETSMGETIVQKIGRNREIVEITKEVEQVNSVSPEHRVVHAGELNGVDVEGLREQILDNDS